MVGCASIDFVVGKRKVIRTTKNHRANCNRCDYSLQIKSIASDLLATLLKCNVQLLNQSSLFSDCDDVSAAGRRSTQRTSESPSYKLLLHSLTVPRSPQTSTATALSTHLTCMFLLLTYMSALSSLGQNRPRARNGLRHTLVFSKLPHCYKHRPTVSTPVRAVVSVLYTRCNLGIGVTAYDYDN